MMPKALSILVACLMLAPLYAENSSQTIDTDQAIQARCSALADSSQTTDTDQLLFNLSQQQLVLDDLVRISGALTTLKPHLPAISQLLSSSDSANSKALVEALKQSQNNAEPGLFSHQIKASEKLVELTANFERISKISPDALALLSGLGEGASLKDILAELMVMPQSQPAPSRHSPEKIKVLFAQTSTADRQASVVLDINQTIVPLTALKRVATPTGFVLLSKVVKKDAALLVHLTTEQGDQKIYYP